MILKFKKFKINVMSLHFEIQNIIKLDVTIKKLDILKF